MPELMEVNQIVTSGEYHEHAEFWKAALSHIEGDFRFRQNWQSYALPFGPEPSYQFEIDGEAAEFIRNVSHGSDLSAFVILVGGIFCVLEKYSASSNVFADSPRLATEAHSGFSDLVPLIGPPDRGLTVRGYLNRIREMVQGSYSYQDFPIGDFAQRICNNRPLSNVFVRFDKLHEPARASANHDLNITISGGEAFGIALEANPAVFTLHFLKHFARHLRNVIVAFANLDQPLSSVSLLDDEEKLRLCPPVERVPVDGTVLERFVKRVQSAPGAIAITTPDREITYAEVDDKSSRLAYLLQSAYAIERGECVGVVSDRSERWVIGLLGVLKAGGIYLPLDPEYPQERLSFMIEDAKVRALLVHSDHLSLLTDFWAIPMVALDFQLDALDPVPDSFSIQTKSDDPAYIIYTSGSTGVPKGVVLRHRGLLNMAQYHVDAFGFDASDRLIQFYSPSFDGSIMEIFVALLAGARLVLARQEVVKDPEQFSAYIAQQCVTTINAPPVYLAHLDWNSLDSVKRVISAGDNARVQDARELAKSRSCHNSYGPTEATVCVTDYVVDPNVVYGARIPVGKPIRNVRVYLLDEQCELVPEACTGEICISGVALANGYLNRDDLTAAAFPSNPFESGERLYRSGDFGVWLPDGNLEITGRRDAQVKIRGYRIELGEIEAVLARHDRVSEAIVLVRDEPDRGKRLVAYTAPAESDPAELRDYLAARLPDYMVPSAFYSVETMPLTPNGKIDRNALAGIMTDSDRALASYSAPANDIEEKLTHIWAQLLGVPKIGVHDNFFQLGGDSILIIQVVSRAQQAGIKLTAQQHFKYPTIAALAQVAVDTSGFRASQEAVIGPAEFSPAQHWFFLQSVQSPQHYNQSAMLEVPASLEPQVIERALAAIIEHHDALRLAFFRIGERWESIHAAPPLSIEVGVTCIDDENSLLDIASRLHQSFDLAQPPLLRAHLFRSGSAESAKLLLVVHHLIIDGLSWRILIEDLYATCRQIETGASVQLPPKTSPFRDWSRRLTEFSATDFEGLDYWRRKSLEIPTALMESAFGTISSSDNLTIEFGENETTRMLQDAPRALSAHINEILLTALLLAFREWSGKPDLLVDLESHGREEIFDDIDVSRTVGWFTAIYPVLLKSRDAETLLDTLRNVKEQLREVPMNGLGYGLARYLRGELTDMPRAEVLFNYMGQIDRVLTEQGAWKPLVRYNGPERSPEARRPHAFELEGIVVEGRLRLTWTFNLETHQPAAIKALAQSYRANLLSLIETSEDGRNALSPSDFPAARLDQKALNALFARMNS